VRRPASLTVVAAAVLVGAGCGGTKHYALDASRDCLRKESGLRVRPAPASDFIASTAIGGAMNVRFDDNQVTLAFSQDSDQADNIAKAYRRFRGKDIGIESALEEVANVVMVWAITPNPQQKGLIHGCLKD